MRSSFLSRIFGVIGWVIFLPNFVSAQWSVEALPSVNGAVSPLWCNGKWICYAQGQKAKNQNGTWLEQWERKCFNWQNKALPFQLDQDWMRLHQASDYLCITEQGVIFSKSISKELKGPKRLFCWNGKSEVLIPTGDHNGDDMHPAWDEGTQTLFFSSNRSGGMGGFDLYRMHWKEGLWSEVAQLQPSVNSAEDERFCSVWKGDLYFSTKSQMGDWDIFKSPREGAWTMKWQLEAPINSDFDDIQWVPYDDGWGGLVSNRNQSTSQLFFLRRQFEQKKVCFFSTSGSVLEIAGCDIDNKVIQLNKSESCILIPIEKQLNFTLRDSMGAVVPFGNLLVRDEWGRSLAQGIMNAMGKWEWSYLPFQFSGISILQWPDESLLAINEAGPDEWIGGAHPSLNGSIFFESGSADLTTDHQLILDQWALFLKHQPTVNVLVSGFADAKGAEDLNVKLALSRAMRTQNYLIQQGVSISQLVMDYSGKSVSKKVKSERKVTLSILP